MSEGLTFETILRHGNPVISRLKVPTVLLGIRRATRPVTMRTGQLSNCPSDRRPAWTPTILEPARRIAPGPNRLLVQLGQDFANDLRHLVSREWLPPFGFRHFFGEGLDRMGAPDQHVSQCLANRFGVIHAAQRAGNVMVWRLGKGVHDAHRFISPTRGRNGGSSIGISLNVPFGRSLVIASFTGVKRPRRRFSDRVTAATSRQVGCVVTVVMSPFWNGHHEASVGTSDDLHLTTPPTTPLSARHSQPTGSVASHSRDHAWSATFRNECA